ncbi:hypothetical protein B0A50_06821 [Salinomyces thailandicus]|uniref:Peptidase A1 domain-containing protein n=1 Tax=Salinomyces thailandicus TaxID=706561 RepID=A0A4U0TQG5_9PEZI|nr:hypothetical protein B0A50_06821 [Salinomyces thailandica]
MEYPSFLLALLLLWCELLAAAKVVPMSVRRNERRFNKRKRDIVSTAVPLANRQSLGLYEINITVGTPPQSMTLDLDTGSSDIWMYGPNAYSGCDACLGNNYDKTKSSTYKLVTKDGFTISYVDETGASGDYFTDIVGLGGVNITKVTLAVANELEGWDIPSPSVMGIGFDSNEAINEAGRLYKGILGHMLDQKLINSRAYSLWLDDLDAASGTILFGGYDTSKYVGNLTVLDIQPDAENANRKDVFNVAWTSLSVNNASSSVNLTDASFKQAALLDSGTSLTYVPRDIFQKLATAFGAYQNETTGMVIVPCETNKGTLDFGFGGSTAPVVSIPFSELAPKAFDLDGRPLLLESGKQACEFGLLPSDGPDDITFGDTFLRSAYVVYDLDNKLIAMANSNFGADANTNTVEIQAGKNPFADVAMGEGTLTSATAATVTATRTGTHGVEQTAESGALSLPTSPGSMTSQIVSSTGNMAGSSSTGTAVSGKAAVATAPLLCAGAVMAGVVVLGASLGS